MIAYGFTARTSLYVVKRMRKEGAEGGPLEAEDPLAFSGRGGPRGDGKGEEGFCPGDESRTGGGRGQGNSCPCEVISFSQTNGEVIRPETMEEALRRIG